MRIAVLFFLVVSLARAADGAKGDQAYREHCAFCHGEEGRGDGPAAARLHRPPADFSSGLFKLRSTPSGELPTDEDLLGTITRGIPGSGMPSFADLPLETRRALVAEVKRLAKPRDGGPSFFESRPPKRVVAVPPRPKPSPKLVADGKRVYEKMGCASCHGPTGRGDGSSASELKDAAGRPLRPTDFTLGIWKSGADPRQLYLRVATGLDGTPMAEYSDDVASARERWAVVEYLLSLAGR